MDKEFHYYFTGLIAKTAGFSDAEAETIAYASEFVDENDVSFRIQDKSGGEDYANCISQTMNILKPKDTLLRIYPIFHFIPGDPAAESAQRKDGKMHLLNTTPNSENANELIDKAFNAHPDTRLYRIGIASHAYVDTWAHQNFVGWYDDFNNIGLDPKPDIGHADGEHHPDMVSHLWVDNRLAEPDINNQTRFLSAAKFLFDKYCNYINRETQQDNSSEWEALQTRMVELMGDMYTGSRNKYKDKRLDGYAQEMGAYLPVFDELQWFNEAIETKVRGGKDSHQEFKELFTIFQDEYFWRQDRDKETTDWFKFQEAVKAHLREAVDLLGDRFEKMGVDLENA